MLCLFAMGLDATKSHPAPVTGRALSLDIPLHRTLYLNLRYGVVCRYTNNPERKAFHLPFSSRLLFSIAVEANLEIQLREPLHLTRV